MNTITLSTVIFPLLLYCNSKEILGQSISSPNQSQDYYLTLNSNSSFLDNLKVNYSIKNVNHSDMLLNKINLDGSEFGTITYDIDLRSSKFSICSGLKHNDYVNNRNNLASLNFSNASPTGRETGKILGRFFIGALVGAASAGVAIVVMAQEPDGGLENPAAWIIGGAIGGGILFVIDW